MIELWNVPPLPKPDRRMILRYAHGNGANGIDALLEDAIREGIPALKPKLCYSILPVELKGNDVFFDALSVRSRGLATFLSGCNRAVLFAATVGTDADRLISRAGAISPVRALLLDAFFTERIEAICDRFTAQFSESNRRFSPGYDDLPLSFQKNMFSLLDCPRKIGLTLSESLLMIPTKSVTAIIGLREGSL
ncbi:MAG: hypothetical protein E7680_01180 [Ruminococcaceae bacterium]|nr:hypothetical protein [Oscillospiraceae bacterium]